MTKRVLVVAAHSDDEALGCAGTIAKHIAAGDAVYVLFMTDGVGSRHVQANEAVERKTSAQKAAKLLRVTSMRNFNFPDNKMDSVPLLDIVHAIEKVITELQPGIIYTHHIGDLNIDHQVAHKAVLTACRPQPDFCVKAIYAFEVLSSTEWQSPGIDDFVPNYFVDISKFIETKIEVLKVYEREMREPPHSRSIENAVRLNQLRGASVGLEYAESFQIIRLLG